MFWRDAILVISIVGAVIGVPSAALIYAGVLWDAHACTRTGEMMAVPSDYSMSTGCMVKYDGRWEPLDWQRSVRIKGKFED